jgi:hypothetical protein
VQNLTCLVRKADKRPGKICVGETTPYRHQQPNPPLGVVCQGTFLLIWVKMMHLYENEGPVFNISCMTRAFPYNREYVHIIGQDILRLQAVKLSIVIPIYWH